MRPVIVVRKDASRKIRSMDDLLQDGVRIACGNPDAAAIGKITKRQLQQSHQWEALSKRVGDNGVFKPTVNEVANDVKLGSVDGGIVWNSTAAQYPELEAVHVPELDGGVVNVDICVLKFATRPSAALHFARYVAARDRGLTAFQAEHFEPVEGDVWKDVPELTFFAGSVNRRALEPIIKAFERREGVKVNTIYNGCGILTGQMKVIAEKQDAGFPDVYMACDVYYLNTVKDWFQEAINVSDTDIVIAVQKGNPKEIHTLQDLLRPGVRVAIGQPDQCTIGVLTRRLLEHEGIYDKLLRENVVTQTATSALLVPAVTAKSADAALAYQTDTRAESDKVDVITIDSELSKAIQPFSIARSSQQKNLAAPPLRGHPPVPQFVRIGRLPLEIERVGSAARGGRRQRRRDITGDSLGITMTASDNVPAKSSPRPHRVASDVPFFAIMGTIGGAYVLLIVGLLVADVAYMTQGEGDAQVIHSPWAKDHPWLAGAVNNPIGKALSKPEIQYSIKLSLVSCTVTTILSLWVAIPIGYLLSRYQFIGCNLLDAVLDIPIVLPPLVVGLSLLILFQFVPRPVREAIVYQVPSVILAQFMVACAFAVRTMRATFDQIDNRREQVALTLGCTRAQAFSRVVLPEAYRGMLTAATLAWARALGEFGPLLVFAGATRNKTEVLSTSVFLELSVGDLEAAVAVSLIMVMAAVVVLVITRLWGTHNLSI